MHDIWDKTKTGVYISSNKMSNFHRIQSFVSCYVFNLISVMKRISNRWINHFKTAIPYHCVNIELLVTERETMTFHKRNGQTKIIKMYIIPHIKLKMGYQVPESLTIRVPDNIIIIYCCPISLSIYRNSHQINIYNNTRCKIREILHPRK